MGYCERTGENDERAIRFGCHSLDGILKIRSATHGKRNCLDTRRQTPFKIRKLPLHGGCRIVNDSNAECTRRYFPEHLSPFGSEAVLPEGAPRCGYCVLRPTRDFSSLGGTPPCGVGLRSLSLSAAQLARHCGASARPAALLPRAATRPPRRRAAI